MYQPLRTTRLYEQLADQLKERIVNNELKAGAQLPNERDLALQFQVSRTVVREAMKTLDKEGLIQIKPGRGTFVVYGSQQAVQNSLSTMLRFDTSNNWEDLIEIRELLEPAISALAAQRASPADIEAMQEAVDAMDGALQDVEGYIASDNQFHFQISKATKNALLGHLIEPIVGLLSEHRKRVFDSPNAPLHGQEHHKKILAAIRRQDVEGARQATLEHLIQVRQDSRSENGA